MTLVMNVRSNTCEMSAEQVTATCGAAGRRGGQGRDAARNSHTSFSIKIVICDHSLVRCSNPLLRHRLHIDWCNTEQLELRTANTGEDQRGSFFTSWKTNLKNLTPTLFFLLLLLRFL